MDTQAMIEDIRKAIIEGDKTATTYATQTALDAGVNALTILNQGLTAGIDEVGDLFEQGEYFLPELMLSGRAMQAGLGLVKPIIESQNLDRSNDDTGTVVIATIQSDIHDIGKNLVASMLSAGGFTVYDLGVDVPVQTITAKAKEVRADIIAVSALLTTSQPFMRDLVDILKASGARDQYKVMVGGASVTPEYAEKIGADGTSANAVEAVRLAHRLIHEKHGMGK